MMRVGLLFVAALFVMSCSPEDSRICSTPAAFDPSSVNGNTWINAQSCIHRWSYRLAVGKESPEQTAEAVVGGCYDAIDKWVNTVVAVDGQIPDYRDPISGNVGDYRSKMFQEARTYALFYVVQARAGHCRVP